MANSVHKSICDQVKETIVSLQLSSILPDGSPNLQLGEEQVEVLWVTEDASVDGKLPRILIIPAGTESIVGGTNSQDDISYPVGIFAIDRINERRVPPMDEALLWRELIRKAFVFQHLRTSAGVELAYTCRMDPGPVFAVDSGEYDILIEPMQFAFISRQARGS